MKSLLALIVVSLFQFTAHADPVGTCSDYYKTFGEMRFQRLAFAENDCVLKASPRASNMIYRAYLASSQGKLLVFESYGSGGQGQTGSKVYHFFPRDRHPSVVDMPDGSIEFQTANKNIAFKFNLTKAILTEMIGGDITMDHNVTPAAHGGLVIQKAQALILESGYLQANDPTTKEKSKAVFRDAQGKTCDVVNTEVFEYFNSGENMFKFNDAELKAFLKTRCPQIDPGY